MLLYNSSNLNLGLRITLVDQFSQPAARIKAAFKGLKDEKRLFEANARAGRDMYGTLAAAGTAATLGMGKAYLKGAKFDYTIRGVAAAAEATSAQFETLKDKANALGGKTMFTPGQVAGSMEMLAKAGYDANQVLAASEPIINLAGAAMEDLGLAADIGVSTMYQFNMEAKDMTYISDLLTQAAIKSNVSLKDLGESLKYASATAVDLGQDLPTVLSLIMTLGNAGMKGSMAGVGIENMYRYMSLGLGEFAKSGRSAAWEKAGLDPKKLVDARGNLKPVREILGELSRALAKFGDVDQQNLLYMIFGVRGKRPPSKFIQDLAQVDKHMTSLSNAGGKAEHMMKYMMTGPHGEWLKFLSAGEAFLNSFTKAMAPVVIPLMKVLTMFASALSWFTNSLVGGAFIRVLGVLIVMKTITWAVKAAVFGVSLALNSLGGTLLGIRNAWVTSMTQMKAATLQLAGATTLVRPRGMAGGAAGAAMGYIGGNRLRQASNGRFYTIGRGAGGAAGGGARFVSNAVAQRYLARYGAATAGGALAGGLLSKGGLAMIGKGLTSFVGGPWGMALLAISFALPLLTGALRKNTDALGDTEQATQGAADANRALISVLTNEFTGSSFFHMRRLYEEKGLGANNTDFILARKLTEYLTNPMTGRYNDISRGEFYDYSHPDEIRIYLDGQLVKTIEREVNKNINASLKFGL